MNDPLKMVHRSTVPVMTEGRVYSEGDGIGYNISIDDDVDGDNVRDGFRSWQKYSHDVWYWENVNDLAVVEFVSQSENATQDETGGDVQPENETDDQF